MTAFIRNGFIYATCGLARLSVRNRYLMKLVSRLALGYLSRGFATTTLFHSTPPKRVMEDKALLTEAMLNVAEKGLARGLISHEYADRFATAFSGMFTRGHDRRAAFRARYDTDPPGFLVLAPTHNCNLRCVGCYAVSSPGVNAQLDFDTCSRIVREQRELWGSHFTVITGGEPFIYRDGGKGLIELCAENPTTFFLVYTNGTLIDDEVAEKLARLGNVTPAISVEGYEKETDARRGKGVHKRILRAMASLRKAQVPFGISVTATSKNVDTLLTDEFWDYYLEDQGALYAWMFQYMPIGRAYTLDLMLSPQERMDLFHATWKQIREKKRFMADFWNCGTAVCGCISAGGNSGYVYVDWNGVVTPCAFNPYGMDNINEVYAKGGNLDTVLFSPYMMGIRKWQQDYLSGSGRADGEMGNVIACCPYRDHHGMICDLIRETGAQPENEPAAEALADDAYHRGLIEYGESFGRLSEEVWRNDYLNHHPPATG